MENWLLLLLGGIGSGLLAGLMGIGGGTVLVPMLVSLQYQAVQAVATSSLAIVMTSLSGSFQNWRMGYLDIKRVLSIGISSLLTAQIGVYIASQLAPQLLLIALGIFLILNIFLGQFKRKMSQGVPLKKELNVNKNLSIILTGGSAGILAGLFGIGGGVIIVPLHMLLLKESIKVAIQTSLGVIVITALSACLGHAFKGNVLWFQGILLGIGGLIGAQVSTRFLPKLPDKIVIISFNTLLAILAIITFWQAITVNSYQ